jgi:hypothetical protein
MAPVSRAAPFDAPPRGRPDRRQVGLRMRATVAVAVFVALVAVAIAAPPGPSRVAGAQPTPGEAEDEGLPRTARDVAVDECLSPERPLHVTEPDPVTPYLNNRVSLADFTTLDSRGVVFDNSQLDRDGFGIAVRLRAGFAGTDLCLVGGTAQTTLDPEDTPWSTWHRVTAVPVEAPRVRVVGMTFRNEGDVLAFLARADDWQVIGISVDGGQALPGGYAHDDCIENDAMHGGLVQDSLFDGCWTFFSATNDAEAALDGSANQVTITGSLVRLQPYRNSFNVPKYGENGHSGFFKWARTDSDIMIPPALSVTDSVFRSDTPALYGGNENGFLGLPPGTHCERVTLIGTETWPADELASWQDQCTDLRLGTVADWDDAVAAWKAEHPPLRDLHGQGRDALARSFGW